MQNDNAKKAQTTEPDNQIENTYSFELELESGKKENIRIPRVTTRLKYRLGLGIHRMDNASEEDLAEYLIDKLVPGLMDRIGLNSPTMESLGKLTTRIIDMDGDTIFGKDWEKKAQAILKKGAKKKKKKKPSKRKQKA